MGVGVGAEGTGKGWKNGVRRVGVVLLVNLDSG